MTVSAVAHLQTPSSDLGLLLIRQFQSPLLYCFFAKVGTQSALLNHSIHCKWRPRRLRSVKQLQREATDSLCCLLGCKLGGRQRVPIGKLDKLQRDERFLAVLHRIISK